MTASLDSQAAGFLLGSDNRKPGRNESPREERSRDFFFAPLCLVAWPRVLRASHGCWPLCSLVFGMPLHVPS